MNDHNSSSATMFSFFLAGSIVGGSVALLLAPQTGKHTREGMRRKLRDVNGSARGLRDRFLRRSERIRDEASRRVAAAATALAGNGAGSAAAAE